VLDQVHQQIENQWFDRNRLAIQAKLIWFGIKHALIKAVNHLATSPGLSLKSIIANFPHPVNEFRDETGYLVMKSS
jgi:hypothetical protein